MGDQAKIGGAEKSALQITPDVMPISLQPGAELPDIAFQLSPCIPDSLTNEAITAIYAAVPGAEDVRITCSEFLVGSNRLPVGTIGIWMSPYLSGQESINRDLGMQSLRLLQRNEQNGEPETYAAFINASYIKLRAYEKFAYQPKRLDGDGNPSKTGPVHLTGMQIDFNAPDQVVTTVNGFDTDPWPDVDFNFVNTDTLFVSAGKPQVTSDRELDPDTGVLDVLTAEFFFALTFISGWAAIGFALFLIEDVEVAQASTPNVDASAGAAVLQLPVEVMVPDRWKVVMYYQRVQVSSGGIFAGGDFVIAPRVPWVSIVGDVNIAVEEGNPSVTRTYSVQTADMRSPLTIAWWGDGIPSNAGAGAPAVTFTVPANAKAGHVYQKQLWVQVTDVDGLIQQAEESIGLHVVSSSSDGNGTPPICRIKPWLPECQG